MKYWKKIDIVTLKNIRDKLTETSIILDDCKMPIDELLEKAVNTIDKCVDELNFYIINGDTK